MGHITESNASLYGTPRQGWSGIRRDQASLRTSSRFLCTSEISPDGVLIGNATETDIYEEMRLSQENCDRRHLNSLPRRQTLSRNSAGNRGYLDPLLDTPLINFKFDLSFRQCEAKKVRALEKPPASGEPRIFLSGCPTFLVLRASD